MGICIICKDAYIDDLVDCCSECWCNMKFIEKIEELDESKEMKKNERMYP